MPCKSLTGIALIDNCLPNAGGIIRMLVADETSITAETVSLSAWTVTNITSIDNFVEFQFGRNVGFTSSELGGDLVARSTSYNNSITTVFTRREATKSESLNTLGAGRRYLRILVQDRNELWWNFPYMQLNTDVEESGTATLDGSKYTVNFIGEDIHKLYEVDSAIIAGLLI